MTNFSNNNSKLVSQVLSYNNYYIGRALAIAKEVLKVAYYVFHYICIESES